MLQKIASRFFGYGEPRTQPGFNNGTSDDIKVFVTFLNERSSGLGMPFPAGKVRSYMKNPNDGALEFIGEDMIDHTPRNERIRLALGNSFDVVGERLRTDFKSNKAQNTMSESFTIELRNQKNVAQKVIVRETMARAREWKITESNLEGTKLTGALAEGTAFSQTILDAGDLTGADFTDAVIQPYVQKELCKRAKGATADSLFCP